MSHSEKVNRAAREIEREKWGREVCLKLVPV